MCFNLRMETETKNKQRAWCSDCRRTAVVVDQFLESTYEPGGEMGFRVTELACGHYHESNRVRVGDAPGKPPAVAGSFPNMDALWAAESFR